MIPIKLYLLVNTVPEEGGLYFARVIREILSIVGCISIVTKYLIVGFVIFR